MAYKCAAGTCHDKCPCLHCQYNKQLVRIDNHVPGISRYAILPLSREWCLKMQMRGGGRGEGADFST